MELVAALIVWLCMSSETNGENAEECVTYEIPQDNWQVTFTESVMLDIFPYSSRDATTSSSSTERQDTSEIMTTVEASATTPNYTSEEVTLRASSLETSEAKNTSTDPEDSWKATATIEDSSGNWCNMTISSGAIGIVCSSIPEGVQSSLLDNLIENRWSRLLLEIIPETKQDSKGKNNFQVNTTKMEQKRNVTEDELTLAVEGNENGTDVNSTIKETGNVTEKEISTTEANNNGTGEVTSIEEEKGYGTENELISPVSLGIGLAGLEGYLILVRDTDLRGPITLKWTEDSSTTRVVTNCWNGCLKQSSNLKEIRGQRPLSVQTKEGFEMLMVTYNISGNKTHQVNLTSNDLDVYGDHQWTSLSLEREKSSLKVLVGGTEMDVINDPDFPVVIGMTVTLYGGGLINWCGVGHKKASNWISVILRLAVIATVALPLYNAIKICEARKNLLELQEHEETGIELQELSSHQAQADGKVSLEPRPEVTPPRQGTVRRWSHESFNSLYNVRSMPERESTTERRSNPAHDATSIAETTTSFVTGLGTIPEIERTSCIEIRKADTDDDLEVASLCSTEAPFTLSTENTFDLDSQSSLEFPRAMANEGFESSGSASPASLKNPKTSESISINVRKRQYKALGEDVSTDSSLDMLEKC